MQHSRQRWHRVGSDTRHGPISAWVTQVVCTARLQAADKLSNRLEQDAAVDIIKHEEHNKAPHAHEEAHAHEQFSDPNEPLLREFAHKYVCLTSSLCYQPLVAPVLSH